MRQISLIIFIFALSACSTDSDFSGSGGKKNSEQKQAEQKPEPEKKEIQTDFTSDASGQYVGEEPEVESTPGIPTENYVKQGTFTVWADPAYPKEKQSYYIYIHTTHATSPKWVAGSVTGSDGYLDNFGGSNSSAEQFTTPAEGGTLVRVYVPGAKYKVKDDIEVKVVSGLGGEPIDGRTERISLSFGR